ncbi:ShlB/FhaC/HecB family hemolysin secretion/activation protein [Pseudomonas turukhanskensis]|uniref:Secretion/activator protein n=1 Tax=Pseudomonas turukhanskensis TaxID=1806536 RepID=A0A9W6KAM9_9PSED|nr:ShlB/FhaC/HecB family hemolysin secretion/activation protein [Pseudomonas turukhanskensis]GLK90755.1 secretion/activator protein [Pseudomonas turukhanskensis]
MNITATDTISQLKEFLLLFIFTLHRREKCLRRAAPLISSTALFFIVFTPYLHAQAVRPPVSPAVREFDIQKKQRLQDEINRELDRNRQDNLTAPAPAPIKLPDSAAEDTGPKFLITTITVDAGEHAALAANISDILNNYENRELGNTELFGLIRDVTNRYAERGFSTTTISLVPKNMKQGAVELKVNWGYVEGWLVNGEEPNVAYQKLITALAMPGLIGNPLNIQQVDQMVENLNNAAKTARIDIQPSQRLGYSYLNLVTEEKPLTLTLRGDNSGQGSPSSGRYRFSASTSLSDLLLGNDTLGLNLSSRRYQQPKTNAEYNAGASYSVPFGYSKVDLRFNHSQYEKPSRGAYGDYSSTGNSQTYTGQFSHVLMREKTQKLTALVELEHKKNANFLEGSLLDVNSEPFTSLAFGLEHVTQFFGGSLYSDVKYNHGLSLWNSAPAAYEAEASDSHNRQRKNFKKIEFNTAWSRSLRVLDEEFNFSSRIGGQYSKDNLMTAEQMGLGDEFTVRGFQGTPLWADQGIYISNTLSLPLQMLGGTITPLIGLDSGYARDVTYAERSGGLTGLALGATGSWKYGGASLTLGVPLSMDDAIKKTTDSSVLYLSTYLSF